MLCMNWRHFKPVADMAHSKGSARAEPQHDKLPVQALNPTLMKDLSHLCIDMGKAALSEVSIEQALTCRTRLLWRGQQAVRCN